MSCEDCLQHAALVQEMEGLKKDVETLKTKQVIMSESHVETKVKLDTVITTLNGLVNDVKNLAALPGKRWDAIVTTIITSGVVGILSFMAGKFIK